MVSTEVIEDFARLRDFQPEWSQLAERLAATPFQLPEWLITWWEHFGSGSLRVMVFRHAGAVAGVLPAFLHEWNGRRQLTLLGSGITDYLDPLFDERWVGEIVERVREQLNDWKDWDRCEWQDLSRDTPLQALGETLDDVPCSALSIDQPFESFLKSRSADLRRNLRRYREKAERVGEIRFEVSEGADPELIDALIELHRARWAKAGQPGMIDANRAEGFVRDVAATMETSGHLRIFALRFAGRVTAVIFALCNRTAIYSWLSAFDPQQETYGFGRELLAQALRYAHDEGYRQWNFLRGDEAYKFSWGAVPIPKCRVVICR